MEDSNHQNNITITDLEASYNKLMNDYKELKEQFEKQISKKDDEIQYLERKNDELRDEASKYQSALGITTNLQSDSVVNNPVSLKNDMLKLQDSLEDYITTCKGNVEIDINEIQKLLKKYGSQTDITKDQKDQKPLIKAVLQRHVIEQILKYGKEYFNFNNLHYYKEFGSGTETHLYNKSYELIRLAKVIANKRDGVDDTTRVLPIKLRQQVLEALGNRGFNDIITEKKQIFMHEFIKKNQLLLNKEIDKYRRLKDPEKKQEVEEKAGEIIKKFVTLFWFRLEIQEPTAKFHWFKHNDNIDPGYMEGTWEDDDIDNIIVDICYFPLIAQEFNNKSKRQIYTPAMILHKFKQNIPKK